MSTRRRLFIALIIPAFIAFIVIMTVLFFNRNQEAMLVDHETDQLRETVGKIIKLMKINCMASSMITLIMQLNLPSKVIFALAPACMTPM